LVEVISACVEAHSLMGPLGSRDLAPGAPGALLASPTPVERVSGAEEGAVVLPGCSLDLHGLLAHGDRVAVNSVRLNFCMAVELSDASGQYARSLQLPWPSH
jgi:hypothetical protein